MQLPRKMSAHNIMASISRSLGKRDSKPSATNEVRFAGDERKDKLYEPKHRQKLMRVLTVVAYVVFVSMAAILLSLYYTFIWNPTDQSVRMMRLDKPECVKPPPDSPIPPISNETQIEKIIASSTTMDDKQLDEPDLSTTQRQKSLWEILVETTSVEETSAKLTSIASTLQDYQNSLTSTAYDDYDDDNESVT